MEKVDVDDHSRRLYYKCGELCARCGDTLIYTEEVYMLTVVRAVVSVEGIFYEAVVSDDGDYLYEPRFMSQECWEHVEEEIRESTMDEPPIEDPKAILECAVCEGGIRNGELLSLATFGEIHQSNRNPDGESNKTFDTYDSNPNIVCIPCLHVMNNDICSIWDGQVQNGNECQQGTKARCWRYGCPGVYSCQLYMNNLLLLQEKEAH
jgi:hypothetical protein